MSPIRLLTDNAGKKDVRTDDHLFSWQALLTSLGNWGRGWDINWARVFSQWGHNRLDGNKLTMSTFEFCRAISWSIDKNQLARFNWKLCYSGALFCSSAIYCIRFILAECWVNKTLKESTMRLRCEIQERQIPCGARGGGTPMLKRRGCSSYL